MKRKRKNWQDHWNFDGRADEYDRNLKMHGYRFNVHQDYETALAMVTDKVQLTSAKVCLDIGIGTGNLGSRFLKRGANVIGVDQSEKMLEKCKEKHPEIDIRKGHFLALPVMDQQVDAVVSSYALHHLPDSDKLLALTEMDRVLKAGGQLCIVDLMFKTHRKKVISYFKKVGNTEAIIALKMSTMLIVHI